MSCTVRVASACAFGRLTPKAERSRWRWRSLCLRRSLSVRRSVDGALSIDWLRREYLDILEPVNLRQFVDM